jgi:hypothetical protein
MLFNFEKTIEEMEINFGEKYWELISILKFTIIVDCLPLIFIINFG